MQQATKSQSANRGKRAAIKSIDLSFRPRSYARPRRSRSVSTSDGADEVVVARVAMASTHGDVISLRAKRTSDGRIRYRMVHEDARGRANRPIRIKPASSARPLTLGELVQVLDGAHYRGACGDPGDQERFGGVIWGTLQLHFEHGIDHAEAYLFFTTITSEHYPQLEAHYLQRMSEWCLANCAEEEDCKKVVRMRLRRG
jgi:hypothetical protein